MIPAQRGKVPPAEAGEPFRPTLTTAAMKNARAERQRAAAARGATPADGEPTTGGFSITDHELPVPPARRPEPAQTPPAAPPGSRANWPLVTHGGRRRRRPARPRSPGPAAPSRRRSARRPPRRGSPRPGSPTTCRRSHPCCGWSSRPRNAAGARRSRTPPRCAWPTGRTPFANAARSVSTPAGPSGVKRADPSAATPAGRNGPRPTAWSAGTASAPTATTPSGPTGSTHPGSTHPGWNAGTRPGWTVATPRARNWANRPRTAKDPPAGNGSTPSGPTASTTTPNAAPRR